MENKRLGYVGGIQERTIMNVPWVIRMSLLFVLSSIAFMSFGIAFQISSFLFASLLLNLLGLFWIEKEYLMSRK